ncbi:MAG: hypothetical protein RIR00_2576 [Pseudomonadota bacterium]|jgi:excisionase family DNA binding protein
MSIELVSAAATSDDSYSGGSHRRRSRDGATSSAPRPSVVDNPSRLAYYTTRQAAEILGIAVRTAQLWVESGILDAWKTSGGHRRITAESVAMLLRQHKGVDLPQQPALSETLPPLRVVVVEDDPIFMQMYKTCIPRWNFPVTLKSARDGYEALLLIGHFMPDIVIADLNLPGVDGFRLIRTVLADEALRDTLVVAVSGLDPDSWANYGGMPKGVPVLPKPIPFTKLEEIARGKAELLARQHGVSLQIPD